MIEINGITKTYNRNKPNKVRALKDISLRIEEGDMASIMGRSGAGKSTLLHVIACIERFDKGNLRIGGIDVSDRSDKELSKIRNEKIGIVMQDFSLIDAETALYNIMLPLYFSKQPLRTFKKKAMDVLERLDIEELSGRKVNEMSGGQKQRVAIARAMINDPEILLADEPTGALDLKTSNEIMELMKKLNEDGMTIVVVTHEKEISTHCRRNIVIEDGEIVTG